MRRLIPAIIVALGASGAVAQAPPTTKIMSCTNGGCHAKQLDHKFLHGPTAVSACDACHEYKDPVKHTFEFKRPGRQLCDFCHIDKTGTEGPVVHQPVANGQCTACHDPHGSDVRRVLKKSSVPELCASCHKDTMSGAHAHKPAAENCIACHKPHTSDHEKLLTLEKRELCLSCHEAVGKAGADAPYPHKPMEGDCTQCHTPHASDQVKGLKIAPKDLCISCHEGIGATIASGTYPHTAATDGRACLNCHTSHGSDHAKQLLKDPVGACLECHKKPIEVDKTRTVPAAGELAVAAFHKHGPIEKGECAPCHAVHGGDRPGLLVMPYEKSFYQKLTDTSYGLCFKCHERALVTVAEGEKMTGFRDGNRNLHMIHVTAAPQGISCRGCHNVHASRVETLIADKVLFGNWEMPLNYKKVPTGGSCAPGCHKAKAYDREKPVGVSPPAPELPK